MKTLKQDPPPVKIIKIVSWFPSSRLIEKHNGNIAPQNKIKAESFLTPPLF